MAETMSTGIAAGSSFLGFVIAISPSIFYHYWQRLRTTSGRVIVVDS
jgi:hypothetical protein